MKRIGLILVIAAVVFSQAGCITTSTYVRERPDQGVIGNRGYFQGNVPPMKQAATAEGTKTRKILNIEIELPPYLGWERYENPDKEVWGNQGYIMGRGPAEGLPKSTEQKPEAKPGKELKQDSKQGKQK